MNGFNIPSSSMQCIENADCLVYDALVDNRILDRCKKDCECIYVGKAKSLIKRVKFLSPINETAWSNERSKLTTSPAL